MQHSPEALHSAEAARALVAILRLAYSGELAAVHAYRGHARSVSDAAERAHIELVEREELHHRALVGNMLAQLREQPSRAREIRAAILGRVLGCLCRVSGWFAPMYGAGKLESRNIREYEAAARHARDAGREEWVDCLLTMAEVEWEHEHWFRAKAASHRFARFVRIWPAPPPKAEIRAAFERDSRSATPLREPVTAAVRA
jgi:rubrerythrin